MQATPLRHGIASSIPGSLNFSLAGACLLLNLYQLFLLPFYLLPLNGWWALTLLPVAALSNSFWSLTHEAIHDNFHPVSRINWMAGRMLSVFFGSPFRVLRLSHLLHHKLNRSPIEGTELYDPDRNSRRRANLGYYFQILGGLYLLEVISTVPSFLPRKLLRLLERRFLKQDALSGLLVRSLIKDETLREVRTDGFAILVLFGTSAYFYGRHWELLAIALMMRAFLISFLDNVYHYRTPVDDLFYAGNLWLPHSLSKMLLNFNLHGIHHKNPAIPWIKLPEVFRNEAGQFDGHYIAAALLQLGGPVPLSELPRSRTMG